MSKPKKLAAFFCSTALICILMKPIHMKKTENISPTENLKEKFEKMDVDAFVEMLIKDFKNIIKECALEKKKLSDDFDKLSEEVQDYELSGILKNLIEEDREGFTNSILDKIDTQEYIEMVEKTDVKIKEGKVYKPYDDDKNNGIVIFLLILMLISPFAVYLYLKIKGKKNLLGEE